MAALSAREFEKSIAQWIQAGRIIVLHGDNVQVKRDLFRLVRKSLAIEPDDPFRLVQLDSDVIDSDPARLADELGAISMFGGSRLIRVSGTARQAEAVLQQAVVAPDGDWLLLVDTDDLESTRSDALKSDRILLIGCGAEKAGDFHSFVSSEFRQADVDLDDGVLELLIPLLGDERSAARGEVEKLAILVGGSGKVTLQDVKDVVADNSSVISDGIALAAVTGNLTALGVALDRLQTTGSDVTGALAAAARLALNLYRGKANQWRGRADGVAQNLSATDLRSIALSLQTAVLQTRSDSRNGTLLAERALIALGLSARTRRR